MKAGALYRLVPALSTSRKRRFKASVDAALGGADGALLPREERYGYRVAGIEGADGARGGGQQRGFRAGPLFCGKVASEGVEIDAPFGPVG